MDLHIPDGNNFFEMLSANGYAYSSVTDAVIPNADADKLMAALTALARGEIEYVILMDGAEFLQAAGDARNGYVLEYNAGSTQEQFRARNTKLAGNAIVEAFRKYLARDMMWRTNFVWETFAL